MKYLPMETLQIEELTQESPRDELVPSEGSVEHGDMRQTQVALPLSPLQQAPANT